MSVIPKAGAIPELSAPCLASGMLSKHLTGAAVSFGRGDLKLLLPHILGKSI